MSSISTQRRLLLAAIGIGLSYALLRPQLSAALVVRGDEMLYRGSISRALAFYRRALRIDPGNGSAVDRYTFVSMLQRTRAQLEEGVSVASTYLAHHASDAGILMDRALCQRLLGRESAAESDFARAGRLQRDPRALVFAGYDALRLGRRSAARRLWREALSIRSGYVPAMRALQLR